jgi:hypothetical protein
MEAGMLDQLVATVSQKTGITPDKARQAVDSVVSQIKAKLPAPVSAHIDEMMAGNYQGTVADVEAKFKAMFAGAHTPADIGTKAKDALSSVQDKLNSMLHKTP